MATLPNTSLEMEFHRKLTKWRLEPTCQVKAHSLGCVCVRPFIKIGALKEWMQTKEADLGKTNGELLFEEIRPIKRHFDPAAAIILQSCTLVFSCLIRRGYGHLINIFHAAGVDDARLRDPTCILKKIQSLKHDLEHHNFEDMMADLEKSRWEFCPYLLSSALNAGVGIKTFGNKLYIPFCRHRSVAESGATADVYLAHIQEEFVSEDIKRYLGTPVDDEKYGKCYRLAIKRLSGKNWTPYDQERRAFRGIRDKPGMLRCLGFYSFTNSVRDYDEQDEDELDQDEHYNMLLEYAEMSLHDFFRNFDPPQLAEEIYSQWKAFCQIAKGIETLHGFDYEGAKWLGWHGDIKPRNLLLVGKEWKLADYGFAVFRLSSPSKTPLAKLTERTETWGAPETADSDECVAQTVDTWSFGCVLSVMATWMVRGYRGVLEYEEYRFEACKQLRHTLHPSDAFHVGQRVLPQIKRWHEHLKDTRRRSDTITDTILRIVDDHLLLKDAQLRYTSDRLRQELDQGIFAVRSSMDVGPQMDRELLQAIKSSRLRLDGSDVILFSSRSHTREIATNSTRRTSTTVAPHLEQLRITEVESSSPAPTIQTTNNPGTTSLDLPNTRSTIETIDTNHGLDAMTLVNSQPAPSHQDRPSLMNGDTLETLTRASTSATDSLAPIISNTEAVKMETVWESAKTVNGGALALRVILDGGHSWIADQIDNNERTPIMVAAKENNLDAVKLLVEHSDLLHHDKDHKTVLHHLIGAQHGRGETDKYLETLRLVLGPSSPPERIHELVNSGNLQHSCLSLCVDIGKMPKTIRELLRKGASVHDTNNEAHTSLLAKAVKKGAEHTVRVMVEENVLGRGMSPELEEILRQNRKKIPDVWRLIEAEMSDSRSQKSSRSKLGFWRKKG